MQSLPRYYPISTGPEYEIYTIIKSEWAHFLIFGCCIFGLLWGCINIWRVGFAFALHFRIILSPVLDTTNQPRRRKHQGRSRSTPNSHRRLRVKRAGKEPRTTSSRHESGHPTNQRCKCISTFALGVSRHLLFRVK